MRLKLDKNGDQFLSKEEVLGADRGKTPPNAAATIDFSKADKNRDGRLSREELQEATKNNPRVRAMFQKLDVNGDGYLSEDELKNVGGVPVVRIQFGGR